MVESVRVGPYSPRRLVCAHCSHLPASWEVERECGKMMLGLGQTKGALEIYLRLELWEEVT